MSERNDWWCGFAVTLVILVLVVGVWLLIHGTVDRDGRTTIERQKTEQVRIQACGGVEDKALRVLCINGLVDR